MTETTSMTRSTPWHLWTVGAISLLWNSYGAYDYTRTNLPDGEAYMASLGMTAAQIATFHDMPTWAVAAWAFGVWGALAGSIFLLLRMKWAFHAFVVSLAGLLVSLVYAYGMTENGAAGGVQGMVMYAVILAACLFFVWYSRMALKSGILR